ncbi:uncharacterized protein LOC132192532 [Neocloeon triangulifer]|uniref:uncharacterized protein LOC132192532 n=1 Tax=Neocloeon triangulifer TaxID=2078957 RepID=UPI00286EBAE3|nr:uncharacterized protein LOC132192532 [Neocloeon triangulifer]
MESVNEQFLADTPKNLPFCRSRSVGLRRRAMMAPSTSTPLTNTKAKEPLAPIENNQNEQDLDETQKSDEPSFLMTSTDWDLLEAEAINKSKQPRDTLAALDDASYLSVSSSMLTPGEGLKPLEVDDLNTLERCILLPAEGTKPEFESPESCSSSSQKPQKAASLVVPKKLFDEDASSLDDLELRKSPVITYKRRFPQRRDSALLKKPKPCPTVEAPQPSMCSTPIASKSVAVFEEPSVVNNESEEEDSLLFELCDEIEKSVQREKSLKESYASKKEQKKQDPNSSIKIFGGFSTASGAKIAVSESSTKAAETLLAMFLEEDIPDE